MEGDEIEVLKPNISYWCKIIILKSRIRETPTLSTDADSRTDTILERLHDLKIFNYRGGITFLEMDHHIFEVLGPIFAI